MKHVLSALKEYIHRYAEVLSLIHISLEVIAIGLVSIAVFDIVLSGLRSYVFSHTTSKIDVELGARLFRHILALPLSYFESRRVGDTIARVRELENIRNCLLYTSRCV